MSKKIIVYPCGDIGIQVISIMRSIYSLEPGLMIDNKKSKYSEKVYNISYLDSINTEEYVLFLASINENIYDELKKNALRYFREKTIIELECMRRKKRYHTKVGRYSYGPICCDHRYIESIGSFCSFATGVDYVASHEMRYLTTHTMIYWGKNYNGFEEPYEWLEGDRCYFPGVDPRADKIKKQKRATIGNDVWLGKNVTVVNSCDIGNGAIAGAGAVITKDVPDYAIVVGVPARIVRYRYNPDQIKALNSIEWWNWSDDEIRNRYEDFYLPIDEFIRKYL